MTKIKDLKNLDALLRHVTYKPPEPIKTNFMEPAVAAQQPETRITMRPTVEEIMRQVAAGPVSTNERGQTIAIGRLRFSDGHQHEQTLCAGINGAVSRKMRMPAGAMLGCTEDNETPLGGGSKPSANTYVADLFKMPTPKYKTRGLVTKGKNYSHEEARTMLAEAIANTNTMPCVTKLPDSLPAGTNDIGACFVGLAMQPKGNGGSMGWEDMCSRLVERETYEAQVRAMSDEDRTTVDNLHTAESLEDLHNRGIPRNRRKVGIRRLRDLCYKLAK